MILKHERMNAQWFLLFLKKKCNKHERCCYKNQALLELECHNKMERTSKFIKVQTTIYAVVENYVKFTIFLVQYL